MAFSPSERNILIELARASMENKQIKLSATLEKKLAEKRGVFVTLKKRGELRGCIGFPEPVLPLGEAIREAAKAAAYEDPRFEPVTSTELKDIDIEITVLTKPEIIKCSLAELPKHISVGTDGLIVRNQYASGLLLPQVATEQRWNSEKFLAHTCIKAGLPPDAWKEKDTKVYKFQGEIIK